MLIISVGGRNAACCFSSRSRDSSERVKKSLFFLIEKEKRIFLKNYHFLRNTKRGFDIIFAAYFEKKQSWRESGGGSKKKVVVSGDRFCCFFAYIMEECIKRALNTSILAQKGTKCKFYLHVCRKCCIFAG